MDFTPDQLSQLRKMLSAVNVSDEHMSRRINLTPKGQSVVSKNLGVPLDCVPDMLVALSNHVRQDLFEDEDRYGYETDAIGHVTLRDAKTGDERFIRGTQAFRLKATLEADPEGVQDVIAKYFEGEALMELADSKADDDDYDIGTNKGGTFNFPYRGKFATARFWTNSSNEFKVKVIGLTDNSGEEVEIPAGEVKALDEIAMKWVDKV